MKKQDVIIGSKYQCTGWEAELIGTDKDGDPVLKPIGEYGQDIRSILYEKEDQDSDQNKKIGCFGQTMEFFLYGWDLIDNK